MKFLLVFTVLCLVLGVQSANILFVSVSPSVSHQVVFQPIWRELSLRGHKVHAITPNPLHDATLTNLTEIDLNSLYNSLSQNVSSSLLFYLMKKPDFATVFIKDAIMTYLFNQLAERAFQHENMQRFLQEEHAFDLVIVEWLFPTMAAFGAKYEAPMIGITSLGAPVPAMDTVGNPTHPIVAPDHNLPVTRDMPFRERLLSALYSVYVRIYYHLIVLPREDRLVKKYLGQDLPYLGDIERNISLLLLNRNNVIHRPIPMVPSIIELNGIKPIKKATKPLTPELKAILDQSKQGAIYFSLGSNIKSNILPKQYFDVFVEVFSQLPFTVLWKFDSEELPNKPKNIILQNWFPQAAVLNHPNLRLFIMQGGLQSTEEAITNKVPTIGIPFASDQTANVDTMVYHGMGIAMDLEDLTVQKLNDSIYEILSKPSYQESASKVASMLYDKPTDGLTKAIWWIEYVLRHGGAKHLRSHSMDIPWYQYLMLDVYGFVIAILSLILVILYFTLKVSWKITRKLCSLFCRRKAEEKKPKKD